MKYKSDLNGPDKKVKVKKYVDQQTKHLKNAIDLQLEYIEGRIKFIRSKDVLNYQKEEALHAIIQSASHCLTSVIRLPYIMKEAHKFAEENLK